MSTCRYSRLMTDDILAFAQRIFDNQPFSRYLGARLEGVEDGVVRIQLALRPELLQQHGFVHGGVLSYLADNALTFAGGIALGGEALTSEFKINYLRPARGVLLTTRAWPISTSRRQSVCTCEVSCTSEDGESTIVAIAQGTIVTVS
jgi:uncharacterized protein (TIGR00369 family)